MMKQWDMFTMVPVHARDPDPGCSVAGEQNRPQGLYEVDLILCLFKNVTGDREPTLPRSPGGPQVDSKVLVAQHN